MDKKTYEKKYKDLDDQWDNLEEKNRQRKKKIEKEEEVIYARQTKLNEKYRKLKVGDIVKISKVVVRDKYKAIDLKEAKEKLGKHYKVDKVGKKEIQIYLSKNDKNSTCRTVFYHPAEDVEKVS